MTKMGLDFKVVVSDIDESVYDSTGMDCCEYAETLAFAKAKDVAPNYPQNIVIGADTIVDLNGQIIGKPDDADHAREIIEKLFSSPHKVITALALVRICDNRSYWP